MYLHVFVLFFIFLPYFFPAKELAFSDLTLSSGLQLLEKGDKQHTVVTDITSSSAQSVLFPFNPNTLDADGWNRLGLQERLVKTILNYRNKGGRFYKPGDLKKIWGMDPKKANQLIPYVELPDQETKKIINKSIVTIIDVNIASLEEWKTLPGIGETLSNRILKYRDQSGGFARVEELQQVYGITDSIFGLIKPYLKLVSTTLPKLIAKQSICPSDCTKNGDSA